MCLCVVIQVANGYGHVSGRLREVPASYLNKTIALSQIRNMRTGISGIASLVSVANINAHPIKMDTAYDFTILEATTNRLCTIDRVSDGISFCGLVFPSGTSLRDMVSLDIIIGGMPIWSIPFPLLTRLSTVKRTPSGVFIDINNAIFGKQGTDRMLTIPLLCLQYHTVAISVISLASIPFNIIVQLTYKETQSRLRLIDTPQEIVINQYRAYDIKTPSRYSIPLAKGMFVMTDYPLTGLSLKWGDIMFRDIGKPLLDTYFVPKKYIDWSEDHDDALRDVYDQKKIPFDVRRLINSEIEKIMRPQYLYWIPFGSLNGTFDDSESEGIVNFAGKVIKVNLSFDVAGPLDAPKIYFMNKNILRIRDGMAGVLFST